MSIQYIKDQNQRIERYMTNNIEQIETIFHAFEKAKTYSTDWRNRAKEDYDFVAGEQYAMEDRIQLESERRPVITFNRIGPVIDAVCGSEVSNRQTIQYIPRSEGDVGINEVLSSAANWLREKCNAQEEESEAFQDVVINGIGWIETRLDYTEHPEGHIVIERIDPFEMYWDPAAKKRNLTDARWIMRVKKVELNDVKSIWPEHYDDVAAQISVSPLKKPATTVNLIEYQWYEFETIYCYKDQASSQFHYVNTEEYKKLVAAKKIDPKSVIQQKRKTCKRILLCEKTILEEGISPAGPHSFTYHAMTGKRDRNKNQWYGLVHAMKDPQKWANKWLSQTLHIINSNAKGGLIAERSAFANPRKAEEDWSDPTSIILLNEGGLNKIKPKPIANYPVGLEKMMEFAISSIRDVSGVNLELLGLAERGQAGVLEHERKQASMALLSPLFSSLTQYRKSQGKTLLYFIQTYLSDGRLIQIHGEQGQKYIPLVKQDDTYEYDVIVDQAPLSTSQKHDVMRTVLQLIPMIQNSNTSLTEEVIDYLPLPKSLIYKWKSAIQQSQPTKNKPTTE